jgi:cation transport ATPase
MTSLQRPSDFRQTYSQMSTEELLRLAAQKDTLVDAAQKELNAELSRRGGNTAVVEAYAKQEEREDNLEKQAKQDEKLRRRRVRLAHFYRLALFMGTAILTTLAAIFLFKMSPDAAQLMTTISLNLALALFFLTFAISGKWLTFRRSVYIAALFSLGLFAMVIWIVIR